MNTLQGQSRLPLFLYNSIKHNEKEQYTLHTQVATVTQRPVKKIAKTGTSKPAKKTAVVPKKLRPTPVELLENLSNYKWDFDAMKRT